MAKLTYKARSRMKKSSFALPGKREKGKGGYPIPDASHARNALARVSQHGSSSEKKEVRAKVHAKFPSIGQSTKVGVKSAMHGHHLAIAQHHAKMAQHHTAMMARHTAAAHKAVGGNPGALIEMAKKAGGKSYL